MKMSTPLPSTSNRISNIDLDIISPIPIEKIVLHNNSLQESVKAKNESSANSLIADNNSFETVESYMRKHLVDDFKNKEKLVNFHYRDKHEISSFTFDENLTGSYSCTYQHIYLNLHLYLNAI